MKNNKLIAEFMGVHEIMHDGYSEYDFDDNTLDVVHEDELQYDTSWDWLMPVVEKCYTSNMQYPNDDITQGLIDVDIKATYQAVVEFINQLNK